MLSAILLIFFSLDGIFTIRLQFCRFTVPLMFLFIDTMALLWMCFDEMYIFVTSLFYFLFQASIQQEMEESEAKRIQLVASLEAELQSLKTTLQAKEEEIVTLQEQVDSRVG